MKKTRGGPAHIEIVEELKRLTMLKCGGNPIDALTVMDLYCGNMIVLLSMGYQSSALLAVENHMNNLNEFVNMFFDKKQAKGKEPEA